MSSANDAPKMELISLLASRNEFIPACPARTCTLSQHGFGGGVCAQVGTPAAQAASPGVLAGDDVMPTVCWMMRSVCDGEFTSSPSLIPLLKIDRTSRALSGAGSLSLSCTRLPVTLKAGTAESRAAAALAASRTPPGRAPGMESIGPSRGTKAECLHVSSVPRFRAQLPAQGSTCTTCL